MNSITTVVVRPGYSPLVKTWDYDCVEHRRAFGGMASRYIRQGGTVVSSAGEDTPVVSEEDVKEWWARQPESQEPDSKWEDLWDWHRKTLIRIANDMIKTGGTLRTWVRIANTRKEETI